MDWRTVEGRELKAKILRITLQSREGLESTPRAVELCEEVLGFAGEARDREALTYALELMLLFQKTPLTWNHLRSMLELLYNFLCVAEPETATESPELPIVPAAEVEDWGGLDEPKPASEPEPSSEAPPQVIPRKHRATRREATPVTAGKTAAEEGLLPS